MKSEPPFRISNSAASRIISITEKIEKLSIGERSKIPLRLRRVNRLKSIHSSLAIENNSLGLGEVSDIFEGKKVLGPPDEITEARNAIEAYSLMDSVDPYGIDDFIRIHGIMMRNLSDPGFRKVNEGVFDGEGKCLHFAPPPEIVPEHMKDLFDWVRKSDCPMLVKSCIFHYEMEFIHPFADGNGRMGRFWQTVLLMKWNPLFEWIPVETIIWEHQDEYYAAIAESNSKGDDTPFLEMMLGAIDVSLDRFAEDLAGESSPPGYSLTPPESMVFVLIKDGEYATSKGASKMLGISTATVSRAVWRLEELGLIERIGSNKNGKWVVARKKGGL